MILSYQIPLSDVRVAIVGKARKISNPQWPNPIIKTNNNGNLFIRQFGRVFPRKDDVSSGFLGEDPVCGAKNAVKIYQKDNFVSTGDKPSILNLIGPSRTFYCDGDSLAKLEMVFKTPKVKDFSGTDFAQFLNYFFTIKVAAAINKSAVFPLYKIGEYLAREYLFSTTIKQHHSLLANEIALQKNLPGVTSGSPLLFIEFSSEECVSFVEIQKNISIRNITLPPGYGAELRYILFPIENQYIPVWLLNLKSTVSTEKLRTLRQYIMRLNADFQNIFFLLHQVNTQDISTESKKKLTDCMAKVVSRISKNEKRLIVNEETEKIWDLAITSFCQVNPEVYESVKNQIEEFRQEINIQILKASQRTVYVEKGAEYVEEKKEVIITGNNNYVVQGDHSSGGNNTHSTNTQGQPFDPNTIHELINKLMKEIEHDPKSSTVDTSVVIAQAQVLKDQVAKEKPNKQLLQITAEGLKKAAENIASVLPFVIPIANEIIKIIK